MHPSHCPHVCVDWSTLDAAGCELADGAAGFPWRPHACAGRAGVAVTALFVSLCEPYVLTDITCSCIQLTGCPAYRKICGVGVRCVCAVQLLLCGWTQVAPVRQDVRGGLVLCQASYDQRAAALPVACITYARIT